MRKKIISVFVVLILLCSFGVSAAETTTDTNFSYLPSEKDWTSFNGYVVNEDYIDCIKIQTDSSKSYYLSYAIKAEGTNGYFSSVKSNINDYAGLKNYKAQKLKISVIDKATSKSVVTGIVVMYRVKTAGRWLPWVSNANPEWMYFVQRKYGLTGVLDTAGSDAGLNSGSCITGIDIRIFEETAITDSLGSSTATKFFDVPYINQVGTYPTGCESVSAVMALQYAGIDITVDNFIDSYLEKGPADSFDPNLCFGGNPKNSNGMGCYAPVIESAIKKAIKCKNLSVQTVYGKSLSQLCAEYVDNNIPVIVWATQEMQTPRNGKLINYDGKIIPWVAPEHCLVLVGYNRRNYIFNDPLTSKYQYYSRNISEIAYYGLGAQAIVITGTNEDKHSFSEWTVDSEPSCTENGIRSKICSDCGLKESEEIMAFGHIKGELLTVREPTIYETGLKQQCCTVCKEVLLEEILAKLVYFGDINTDGCINGSDLVPFRQWLLKPLPENANERFDINGDKEIDIVDFIRLKRYISGEEVNLG